MFNKRKLKKKKEISIILFLINIEISINNKDTIRKTSKLIRAVQENPYNYRIIHTIKFLLFIGYILLIVWII